jgi:5-methylcytosine-specific restriction endonuclease McrA
MERVTVVGKNYGSKKNTQRRKPVKYYSPKRRAVYSRGDEIDHLTLFELHAWTCWVCREPINRFLRKPHFMAATVEHIIPLCQGGTHTWDNVAPSHAICNFQKGDSLLGSVPDTLAV